MVMGFSITPHQQGTSQRRSYRFASVASTAGDAERTDGLVSVNGVECRTVGIDIGVGVVDRVHILEATAASQDTLVDMALEIDDDDDDDEQDDGSHSSDMHGTKQRTKQENQLKEGDPYGFVLWPAASAVASYLLSECGELHNKTILEVGAGTGLVSIAASMARASSVLATDYESAPLELLRYAAQHLNDCPTPIDCDLFDLKDDTTRLPTADIVVAADIMYEPSTGRAMAKRAVEAIRQGRRVLVGDSPGRAGRPAFLDELQQLGLRNAVFVDTVGRTCAGPRHELICGKGSLSVSQTPGDLVVAIMDIRPEEHSYMLER